MLLVVSVLAMFLAAMAPAAYSDQWKDSDRRKDSDHWKDSDQWKESGEGGWHHKRMSGMIKRIDIPITVTGMADNSATFTVQNMAIGGKKGKVMVITLDRPLTGKYNMTKDMAYVSTGDMAMDSTGMGGMSIRVDTPKNATIPVAGASAILGLSDIRIEYMGKDYTVATFSKLSVYLPDGKVKTYHLEKPVKVVKSKERKSVAWDAYPGFTRALEDALKGGATFPADAMPLRMSDYAASVMSSKPMKLSDIKSTVVATPTPTVVPSPTPTVEPSPTPTP